MGERYGILLAVRWIQNASNDPLGRVSGSRVCVC